MSNKAKIWLYKEGNECTTITGGWGNCINNGAHSSKFVKKSTYMASDAYGVNRWIAISTINKLNSDLIYNITVEYDLKQVSTTTGNEIVMTTNMSNWSTMDANIKYRDTFTPTVLGKGSKTSTTVDISNQEGYITLKNSWGSVYFCGVYITTKEEVISIVNQDNISLSFNLNNMNNKLSFTQIDILTNGNVIQSYTGNLSEITYEFDKALMDLGDNEISIKATYTQGDNIYEIAELISDIPYKKELVLEELDPIVDLPSTSTLKDVIQRFSVIESTNKAIKNNLKLILEFNGVGVEESLRLSDMVKLIRNLFIDDIEINKYADSIRQILINKNVECSETDSIETLISKIDLLGSLSNITYLYDTVDNTSITGGWGLVNVLGVTPTFTQTTSGISFSAVGSTLQGSNGRYCTVNTIDMTKYKKLKAIVNSSSPDGDRLAINVVKTRGGDNASYTAYVNNGTAVQTSIDISDLSGNYYVQLLIGGNALNNTSGTVIQLWLES